MLLILLTLGTGVFLGVRAVVRKVNHAVDSYHEKKAEEAAEFERKYGPKEITVGATGSFILHGPILNSERYSRGQDQYDFSDCFKFIKSAYSKPDFMTSEFEGSLTGGDYSGYPSFQTPDILVQNIADSGIDLQNLASNHLYDGMSEGFRRTMDVFNKRGLLYGGVRMNTNEKPYHIEEINDIKVGYINYVYETNENNGDPNDVELNASVLRKEDVPLINTFNYKKLDKFYKELEENLNQMRADGAQFLIVNLHWGTEYQLQESQEQRNIAKKLCEMGVDAIIGGHPHCEQPIDMLETDEGHRMFCIYSVGNAFCNQRKDLIEEMPEGHTEDGVIVTLTIHRNRDAKVLLRDVNLTPTWVYCQRHEGNNLYYILPLDDVENLEKNTGLSGIKNEAQASYDRTMEELGPGLEKVKEILSTVEFDT